jgi:ketosteroid isomerase-like protein
VATEANKETVERFFHANGDVEAVRPLFADDVVWWVPASATRVLKLDRRLAGWDAIPWLGGGGFGAFEPGTSTFHLHHLVAEGDLVSAHFNRTARLSDGSPYDTEYNILFRLRDGLIAEVWEVADTAAAFGPPRRREGKS